MFFCSLSQLSTVKTWLAEQEMVYTTFLECGTKTLGLGGVSKVEKFVSDFFVHQEEPKTIEKEVSPQMLFRPETIIGLVPPDIKAQHKLLDRIISVRKNFTVPLGFKGTIIGIQEKEDKWKNVYEVLFDSSFTGYMHIFILKSLASICYNVKLNFQ